MCELLHTSAVVQKMQGGLELAINSRVGGLGKLAERIEQAQIFVPSGILTSS